MGSDTYQNTVKFLFLSDTHFGVHYALNPRNMLKYAYGNRFFDQVEKIFEESIKQDKIDFILHGGDFFNRSKPPSKVVEKATSLLLNAAKDVPIYLIPGNHERSRLPIGLLEYQDNIHVFKNPSTYVFKKGKLKVRITGFPYIRHHASKKFSSIIKDAGMNVINEKNQHSDYNILLMHQLITGSKVEHYTFLRGHNVIDYNDIPRSFHLVATGHVHRFQYLFPNPSRIQSVHSLYEVVQNINEGYWSFKTKSKGEKSQYERPIVCYSGTSEKVSFMECNENKGYIIGSINKSKVDGKSSVSSNLEFIPTSSISMLRLIWDLNRKSLTEYVNITYQRIQELSSSLKTKSLNGIVLISINDPQFLSDDSIFRLKEFALRKRILLKFSPKKIK